MTRPVALMYHDVLAGDPSGFDGPGADAYKMTATAFDAHLDELVRASCAPQVDLAADALRLTFDDGGASAHAVIADRLEARGWRGFFFVTTSRIDTPGFLAADEIADLDRRGHVIGSHSNNHPLQMARLPADEIRSEWSDSCAALEAIIGRPVKVASIPGGAYSDAVAQAAAGAGIRDLFTSEPRRGSWTVGACRLHGRYTVKSTTSPAWVADVARGARAPRWRQRAEWEAKKVAKRSLGRFYMRLRNRLA